MTNNAAHYCHHSDDSFILSGFRWFPKPLELPALPFPCVGLVPHCRLWEADILFLLLSLMEDVCSLVPCVLRMLPVAVCGQAH